MSEFMRETLQSPDSGYYHGEAPQPPDWVRTRPFSTTIEAARSTETPQSTKDKKKK